MPSSTNSVVAAQGGHLPTPPTWPCGELAIVVAPAPPRGHGGALQMVEGGRWMVTLIGVLGDHPPTDPAGFLAFARSLPVLDIHDAIAGAEPLDDAVPFRFPHSVRRRYERLSHCPERLIVLGDSLCSFNPVYGQGITVAALEARALRTAFPRRRPPRSGPSSGASPASWMSPGQR